MGLYLNFAYKAYFYKDMLIYSPDVKVILDLEDKEIIEPWNVDIITAAFPNLRHIKKTIDEEILSTVYERRIETVFQVAIKEKVDCLILGAWGCGVFKNDPIIVAKAMHKIQDQYSGYFEKIIYPIYCLKGEESNYEAFMNEFFPRNNEEGRD